ncbi:hypothetical protein F5X68DRAFT_75590 [Plectosphaerella plurivora]|uniref:Uncharacterized protein n=1 Tax=Plectosphaerella plurivora TaxID=936078 RepID=A0A9P9ACW7_9PEZI|nr:hypothetical protein F5X68DRAFT_75590 [Plectosphaerella plurivora]
MRYGGEYYLLCELARSHLFLFLFLCMGLLLVIGCPTFQAKWAPTEPKKQCESFLQFQHVHSFRHPPRRATVRQTVMIKRAPASRQPSLGSPFHSGALPFPLLADAELDLRSRRLRVASRALVLLRQVWLRSCVGKRHARSALSCAGECRWYGANGNGYCDC